MQGSPFQKILLMMTLAAIAVALLLHFINSRPTPQPALKLPTVKSTQPESQHSYTSPPKVTKDTAKEAEADEPAQPKIPRDKAEAWLAKHNRNAASLLTAFRALGDTNYLNEAATNFPGDPQVQLAALSHNSYPEERRKWLDLFKASSPSNSLANYFSAQEYFQNGRTDEAVQELLAASAKSQFDNHTTEIQLDAEEMYLDSGKTPREAFEFAMSASSQENISELVTIKRLDQGIGDLMKQKTDAGDADSAANLTQIGLAITDKLKSGDSGKYIINQMVGIATDAIMLSHLDQNTAYDFLGDQTPAQILQANKQQRTAFRELFENFGAIQPGLTEAEMNNYYRRSQLFGEAAAMKWVIQQHPPADAPK